MTVVLAALLTFTAAATHADQAPWGPVTGRTSAVYVQHGQYGNVNVSVTLNSVIPSAQRAFGHSVDGVGTSTETATVDIYTPAPLSTTLSTQISGICANSLDPTCNGLMQINGCVWGTLPSTAQQALTTVLGSCSKQCFTGSGANQFGEIITINSWQCAQVNTAECMWMTGTLGAGMRIDILERKYGCQF